MGVKNNPAITESQVREEWKKARGIESRKEFEKRMSEKSGLLLPTIKKYIGVWKIYDLDDVDLKNNTPKKKRPGYHKPEIKEENEVCKEEVNTEQKIESKKPIEEFKELDKDEPTEKLINTVQGIINTIPSKPAINYTDIALEIGELVQGKNAQYGNAINDTEEFLELLYPNGITLGDYKNIGAMVRVLDKLKRIANGNQGEEDAWQDIAGYGVLMCGSDVSCKSDTELEKSVKK